jgi:mRNA-degrading endonuclease toxin of MazEF toxin-antitoxin module
VRAIVPGQVFWLDDCPPLDGQDVKRRPVVIIDDTDELRAGADPVIVVAITSTDCQDADRVDLPNTAEEPGSTTGLPEPCCALPRWILQVERARLSDYAGYLPKVTLERLLDAVERRMDEWTGMR